MLADDVERLRKSSEALEAAMMKKAAADAAVRKQEQDDPLSR